MILYEMQSVFQFTTSRGGRRNQCICITALCGLSIHDLTRRSTRLTTFRLLHAVSFNSRPHEEVDSIFLSSGRLLVSFNSRPHEEVDLENYMFDYYGALSIHDLTRRSTSDVFSVSVPVFFQFTTSRGGRHLIHRSGYNLFCLSIHDLTRRSTSLKMSSIIS